jgi:hypothetical protein
MRISSTVVSFTGGRLNASPDNLLPFGPKVDDCLSDIQPCFNSGNEILYLLSVLYLIELN